MLSTTAHSASSGDIIAASPRLESVRLGCVLKRYPRYSETFIVRYILAHEAAGLPVEIFSLDQPNDQHFQGAIAQVQAPVTYLPAFSLRAADFWTALERASELLPGLWAALEEARGEEARRVYQAVLLAYEARRRGINHLHAHFATSATTVARLAARFAGLSYTFHAHAKDIYHQYVRPDDFRRKLEEAAAVITVTDYNLRFLRETYGEAAEHVHHIYNGLDLEVYSYHDPGDRLPRIVSVGRLVEKKGFDDLIEACAVLARQGRDFACQIVGTGDLEALLRARIEQLGLVGVVELLGARPEHDVMELIQDAAVFALPCIVAADGDRDGLPNVLLEAMALGTPCVSTDVNGVPEMLHDGETGLVVPQHDPGALAEAIGRLLDDSPLRVRLAEAARRLTEADLDIHRNTAKMRAIFRAAVELRRVPARLPA